MKYSALCFCWLQANTVFLVFCLPLHCAVPRPQVDPADSLSTGDVVPNRLALLMCQAMLMRGDDAQSKLQAAVGYLAVAKLGQALQLPSMLSNCMEALFTTEDWERYVLCHAGWGGAGQLQFELHHHTPITCQTRQPMKHRLAEMQPADKRGLVVGAAHSDMVCMIW